MPNTNKPLLPDTPESWGNASRGYAEIVAPLLMRPFIGRFVERLELGPEAEVLEVGAGSGIMTEVLAPRVRSLLATDFAPKMVSLIRERMQAGGITNVRCEVMDGQALELEDSSFDAAASSFALMFFPDRIKGFSELHRILRPGGRAVVSGWAGADQFEAFGLFLEGMRTAFPDLPPPSSPPPVLSLSNPAAFKAEMEAGGFAKVEVELVSREMEVPDFEVLWSALTAGAPPVQMLFDLIGPDGKARLYDVLLEIVQLRFGSGPIRLTNVATLGIGCARK